MRKVGFKEVKLMRLTDIVNNVYSDMRSKGRKIYKKEIKQYLECYKAQDYTPMWSTDLYINRGGTYCEMIEKVYVLRGDI